MIEQHVSTIDYYVWLLSDWAYLGGVRFVQLAARHGLKINHIPMRMQDVYAGSGGVLLANRSWQRQAYRITELKRWRSRLGIPVNIEPKFYPADVDLASCVVIAAQQRGLPVADFVNAVMRAVWAEDRNVADPGVLVAIAERCGLEGRALLEAADVQAVRAEYRGNTERAAGRRRVRIAVLRLRGRTVLGPGPPRHAGGGHRAIGHRQSRPQSRLTQNDSE
jgi:2-hydroxychromene-2-carboxylate isomerase